MTQPDPVQDTINRCRVLWAFSDIPGPRITEMSEELESHLRERIADGGSVGDVVGPDLRAFALAWAETEPEQRPLAQRWLRWTNPPLIAVAACLLAQHAVNLVRGEGLNLALEAGSLWMIVIVIAGGLLLTHPAPLRDGFARILLARSVFRVFVLGSIVGLILMLSVIALSIAGERVVFRYADPGTVHWPWLVTLAITAGTGALFWLDLRARRAGRV